MQQCSSARGVCNVWQETRIHDLIFRLDAGLPGVASSSWKARLFIHRKRCCLQKTSTFMKTACQLQASSIHGEHILSRTHSVEETSVNHGPAEQPVPSACSLAAASDVLIQRSSSICLFISSPAKMWVTTIWTDFSRPTRTGIPRNSCRFANTTHGVSGKCVVTIGRYYLNALSIGGGDCNNHHLVQCHGEVGHDPTTSPRAVSVWTRPCSA